MKFYDNPPRKKWPKIIARPGLEEEKVEEIVKPILDKVRRKGDKALYKFTKEFDHVELDTLLVSREEIKEAASQVSDELKEAIGIARDNIEKFHQAQVMPEQKVETQPGVLCMRKSVPIQRVGLYVPAGTAPLFSTVLMLGVPANLAGCEEVLICSPVDLNGKVNPIVLYAADLVGIDKIVKVGGAQAIAAMAYGTESVPKVDKIFGPGNQYVTAAKQLLSKSTVAIDMPAGPSEVAIFADHTAVPAFVAADLLSQAEHGVDSQVLLVSNEKDFLEEVEKELQLQLNDLPRKDIARKALENSRSIWLENKADCVELLNEYGAEHLILSVEDADQVAEAIINAGSVFIGNFTPESAGDYASGTNHTLPTNGYAKAYSGVSLDSFLKKITYQKITASGLQLLGPVIEKMAEAEQLAAHKNAVSIRLKFLKENA